MSYLGNSPEKDIVINKKEYIATEGQTSFGVVYDDYVEVYLNGVRLSDSDYTALTGANIVLAIPASAGDIIQCSGFQSVTFVDAVKVDGVNGAAQIPYGSTAQRPTSPDNGYLRYNTDLLMMESYSNGEWGGVGGDPDFPMVNNLVPTGETVSIPAGRTLVHPNLQVDGTLEIAGTLFIPSGGSVSTTEVDATIVKQNGNVVANDSAVVHKTGNETIAGIKTFTSSPIVPTPTTGTQAANKDYVDSSSSALPIGIILNAYVIFENCIVAFGGEFNRADYPKLWAYLQANPTLVKTQAQWTTENTTNGMCGFFSDGNGTTTFRVPNLDKAFLRPDSRTVGSFQADDFKLHQHGSVDNGLNDVAVRAYQDGGDWGSMYASSEDFVYIYDAQTTKVGGSETRPKNIAVLPLIVAK